MRSGQTLDESVSELSKLFDFCVVSLQAHLTNQHLDSNGQCVHHAGRTNEISMFSWSPPQNKLHSHGRMRRPGPGHTYLSMRFLQVLDAWPLLDEFTSQADRE